jgi:hypothetical protein
MTEYQALHPEADRWGGWSWREPAHGEHFRRCSYCGSVHPADLAAEPAWRASWADQKYGWPHKFYVDIPNREPDALFAVGATSADAPPGVGWTALADLTAEQRAILDRDRMASDRTTFVLFDTRPNHFGKFYSIHLSDPAIDEATKEAIQRRSGVRFTFANGRVSWAGYAEATP